MKKKQIIEQELNKNEQELNKKEQELQNNTIEINDLKRQKKLLKEGLDNFKKINESKTKENDELRDEINKLKEAKIQRPNIIDKDSTTLLKIFQDVRKRDDKVRTFAPSDNDEMKKLAELTKAKIKMTDDLIESNLNKKVFGKIKRPKDLEIETFLENINKYEDINLNDVNNLIDEIIKNITMCDNVLDLGDNKYVYFNHINDFYTILNMVISIILIEKKNMKKSLKILKTSSQIKKIW